MTAHEVVSVDDLEVGDVIKARVNRGCTRIWKISRIEEFPKMRSLMLVNGSHYPTCTYKRRGTLVYRECR